MVEQSGILTVFYRGIARESFGGFQISENLDLRFLAGGFRSLDFF